MFKWNIGKKKLDFVNFISRDYNAKFKYALPKFMQKSITNWESKQFIDVQCCCHVQIIYFQRLFYTILANRGEVKNNINA